MMNQPNTQLINPKLLHDNPYQRRGAMDRAELAKLADSIRVDGLKQIPHARPHPMIAGAYQLEFGHRRREAWKLAFPGQPMPVEIVELTDRQMSDGMSAENGQRADLSPIEIARDIQARQKEFGLALAEAARPYGYDTATASNKLRLLDAPKEIRALVDARQLAERNARQLLVVARLDANKAVKLAEQIVTKDTSAQSPEEMIDDAITEFLRAKGKPLYNAPWELNWPKEPLRLEPPVKGIVEIPACKGCAHFFAHGNDYCANPVCYAVKFERAAQEHVERAARKLGIAASAPGEKPTILYDGSPDYRQTPAFQALVKSKSPELRVVAWTNEKDYHGHNRKDVCGDELVALASVDAKKSQQWLKTYREDGAQAARAETNAELRATETDAQKRKRLAREEREAAERRAERAAQLKNEADVTWLITNTARIAAEQMTVSGAFLKFVQALVDEHYAADRSRKLGVVEDELQAALATARGADADRLRREHIALSLIAVGVVEFDGHLPGFGEACERIDELCQPLDDDYVDDGLGDFVQLGIQLPKGWNKPPTHHTTFNCWHCNQFASNEKITKRDIEQDGWVDDFENADAERGGGVFCSAEHQTAYQRAQLRAAKKRKK